MKRNGYDLKGLKCSLKTSGLRGEEKSGRNS